jgi:hypothetical protein
MINLDEWRSWVVQRKKRGQRGYWLGFWELGEELLARMEEIYTDEQIAIILVKTYGLHLAFCEQRYRRRPRDMLFDLEWHERPLPPLPSREKDENEAEDEVEDRPRREQTTMALHNINDEAEVEQHARRVLDAIYHIVRRKQFSDASNVWTGMFYDQIYGQGRLTEDVKQRCRKTIAECNALFQPPPKAKRRRRKKGELQEAVMTWSYENEWRRFAESLTEQDTQMLRYQRWTWRRRGWGVALHHSFTSIPTEKIYALTDECYSIANAIDAILKRGIWCPADEWNKGLQKRIDAAIIRVRAMWREEEERREKKRDPLDFKGTMH